jgi:hypothetical protein
MSSGKQHEESKKGKTTAINKDKEKQNEDKIKFDTIVKTYLDEVTKVPTSELEPPELEVRFGTMKNSAPLTKDNVTNIIKKLKSLKFQQSGEEYSLRIFLNDSDARVQIDGFSNIQNFCIDNSIADKNATMVIKKNMEHKVTREDGSEFTSDIRPVDNADFDFRVSLQTEREIGKDEREQIISGWKSTGKNFRYIRRTAFTHPDYPVRIDISIVKDTFRAKKSYGDFKTSNVMRGEDKYEVEIEVDNSAIIKEGIKPDVLLKGLRECIKLILSGIQSSNFPISNDEMRQIQDEYSKLIYSGDVRPPSRVAFIGPASVTLQIKNIAPVGKYKMPSIRKNYSVTDKADGLRKLLFVSSGGKIYLIDPLLNVQFTGLVTEIKAFHNTLLDGEHVLHDKNGGFINLYLAFDIYFIKGESVRERSFYTSSKEHADKSRHSEMLKYIANVDAKPILKSAQNPLEFKAKRFYFDDDSSSEMFGLKGDDENASERIFMLCKQCLDSEYRYVTDGLILTPCNTGVGGTTPGQVGPLDRKFTWPLSFKWKPPQYNTVDFLVNTVKDDKTNRDKVVDKIEGGTINGTNMLSSKQVETYKELVLKVGFDPSNRSNKIIPNACAMIYEGTIDKMFGGSGEYKPIQFLPSNPYDASAGLCLIKLNSEGDMVTEEGAEVFEDLTIVEFKYDKPEKRWVPLRVRYDKTADLRKNGKNFGNDYKTADSVWYSIHYPVTEDIIKGVDKNINYDESSGAADSSSSVSDVYYKSGGQEKLTEGLRDFHNKFVKSALIYEMTKSGDTLIDFAVGKAGDLHKWKESGLSFIYGIDISRDNIENPANGACARYVNFARENAGKMDAMFVVGNSSRNVKDGGAFSSSSQLTREISNSVFGKGSVDALKKLGLNGVVANYGKGEHGFDVSSIQFAVHYMFENEDTLNGFLRNVCECTKMGGVFIGTTFNGKKVFDLLKRNGVKKNESYILFKGTSGLSSASASLDNSKKIIEIVKKYDDDLRFPPDEFSLGYEIQVWQESINNYISEYLVNFEYLDSVMSMYGFEPHHLDKGDIFRKSRASFEELFKMMREHHASNPLYNKALTMSNEEKTLSFLNDYFIYKKVRDVDCANLRHSVVVPKTEKQKTFAIHDKQGLNHTRLVDLLTDHKWKQVDIKTPNADFAWVGATVGADFLRYEESIYEIKTTLKNLLKGNGVKGYSTSDPDYPYTKNVITDKAQLYIELNKKCPDVCKKYMAESWLLSDEKRVAEYSEANDGILIIKTLGVGAGGGEGIVYVTNKEELTEFTNAMKRKKEKKEKGMKEYLVSQYIRNPMLIEGKKFHLRMYFMVCMRPNNKSDWFLFEEGKIITAELPYKDADYMNKKIHDTHFKSTKKNRLFPESRELGISDKEAKSIMQQMREVLRCAYDVYKPHIASTRESKYGFEVFGCDFMVTIDGRVKLLEINARHDYGVNDVKKESPEVYERFCSDFWDWIYKNAIDPIFSVDGEKYESEHDRTIAIIEKGFPFVERFWTKDDVQAAYTLIKNKVADVSIATLRKEHYIQNTAYDILTGKKETEEVNKFIRQYIGANDNLKFKNGKSKGKGEFISIKSPDENVLDKDYLLVDYFTEPSKITVRLAKGEPSLEEHFTKGTLVEKAVRLLRRKSVEITDESLHGAIMNQSSDGSSGSREFNMKSSIVDGKEKKVYLSSAENVFVYVIIWKLLFPEMSSSDDFSNLKILDGAGGYGSRLMAAIMLNANYVGVEPNPLSTPGFNKMIEMFGSSEKQKMLEDGLPNAAGVNAMPPGWADVVMFSPPMWGKEVYNDETVAKQSINMFSNEKMWLDQFLHASIEELWSHLRVGGFIVFQSVRYDYIGEYMIKEHAEKRKDAIFRGILSRVTSAGRYKPNWVWQKINPDVIEIEGEGEEGKERNVETVVKEQEGKSEQESKSEESRSEESKSEESKSEESKSEESKSEESKSEESKSEEGKLPKKKVIFVKKKTLKKMPTPTPE